MATLSSPTLQNLITSVRGLLNQPDRSNSTWSDEEITRYLNDGISMYFVEVANANEGQFDTSTDLNIVSGTETVALPSDFYAVRALYKKIGVTYEPCAFRNRTDESYTTQGGSDSQGFVPDYYFRGNNLVLRPVPGFSETAGLKLEYKAFPTTLLDGGDVMTANITPVFKQVVEFYAVWKCKLKEALVNNNSVDQAAYTALSIAYNQFKDALVQRTHQPTYTKPFNPETEGA